MWPHDTSLIRQGLTQYGFRTEANQLIMALLYAAASFDFRLPEVFAGYSRDDAPFRCRTRPARFSCHVESARGETLMRV